jgi:ankyrin repeat protein
VDDILKFGSSANWTHVDGDSLVNCVLDGHDAVIDALLSCGMPDKTSSSGQNVVIAAVLINSPKTLKKLLSSDFSHKTETRNALETATRLGFHNSVKQLLDFGIPVPVSLKSNISPELSELFGKAGLFVKEENVKFAEPNKVFSLMDICRNSIRKNLNTEDQNLLSIVHKLSLPDALKMFITNCSASDVHFFRVITLDAAFVE